MTLWRKEPPTADPAAAARLAAAKAKGDRLREARDKAARRRAGLPETPAVATRQPEPTDEPDDSGLGMAAYASADPEFDDDEPEGEDGVDLDDLFAPGRAAIRRSVADARPVEVPPDDDAPAGDGAGSDGTGGETGADRPPPRCPIIALGEGRHGHYYFLGPTGNYRVLTFQHIGSRAGLASIFQGRTAWLRHQFPAKDKEGKPTDGWSHDAARDGLMRMCATKGLFDPQDRLRGPGAWRDKTGRLIVHCGDRLLMPGRKGGFVWKTAGVEHEGMIYPAQPAETKPAAADKRATAADGAALLALLKRWKWQNPTSAPILQLGLIAQGFVSGALDWRSHGWLTGDQFSGKSELQGLLKALWGTFVLQSSMPTEAGVRQMLAVDESSRVVVLDEMEPDPGTNKVRDMVQLARVASGGGSTSRGSAGGEAQRFSLHCALMFGSILYPRFLPQDAGRIEVLELDQLRDVTEEDRADFKAAIAAMTDLGPAFFRRMVEGWERLQRNLAVYRSVLSRWNNATVRKVDQLSILLACAETLLSDAPATEEAARETVSKMALPDLSAKATEANHDLCVLHLWTAPTQQREHGRAITVGELVEAARGPAGEHSNGARTVLRAMGIKLATVWKDDKGKWKAADWKIADGGTPGVAVANIHQSLNDLFAGTHWENGVWPQALFRTHADAKRCEPTAFVGVVRSRCVWVPGEVFFGQPGERRDDRESDAADDGPAAPVQGFDDPEVPF